MAYIGWRQNDVKQFLKSDPKRYRRQMGHDGVYATATLMAGDDALTAEPQGDEEDDVAETGTQQALQLQREQQKTERKAVSKEQREAQRERKLALRQEKRREKHKGH